jgi:hypothetical protein
LALHSAHPHHGQSALVTLLNTAEGFGKTYGGIEYEKWWSTKQFGRASQTDRLRGKTTDKWYRAPVKATAWFALSTTSDFVTNSIAFGSVEQGWHFTQAKAVGRLAASLANESVWGAIPFGKQQIPANEIRKPHSPLYKEMWSGAKFLCKRIAGTTKVPHAPANDPEPALPENQLLFLTQNIAPSPAEP